MLPCLNVIQVQHRWPSSVRSILECSRIAHRAVQLCKHLDPSISPTTHISSCHHCHRQLPSLYHTSYATRLDIYPAPKHHSLRTLPHSQPHQTITLRLSTMSHNTPDSLLKLAADLNKLGGELCAIGGKLATAATTLEQEAANVALANAQRWGVDVQVCFH